MAGERHVVSLEDPCRDLNQAFQVGCHLQAMTGLLTYLRLRLREAFSVDVRSLACFRIALGAVLVGNLLSRSEFLTALYTDQGILPRAIWGDFRETPAAWSVHLIADTPALVMLFLGVQLALGVGICVGWRTRLCCGLSWLLLISLHHRNPLVVTGGDVLLGMFLFWGMLLPLDRHWAVGGRIPSGEARRTRQLSLASVGLITQIVVMYFISGLTKCNPAWFRGDAIGMILQYDMLVRPWGATLQQFQSLSRVLTYGTLALELVGPWLLLATAWRYRLRWAAWFAFALFHVGIALTMDVKWYSYVSLAGLLVLVPTPIWQSLRIRTRCLKELPVNEIRLVGAGRQTLAAVGLTLMLLYNGAYMLSGRAPVWLENATSFVTWNQRWSMFAVPRRINERHVMFAELADGDIVDVLRQGAPIPADSARSLSAKLPDRLWNQLCVYLNFPANAPFRDLAAHYRMRTWNEQHIEAERIQLLEYRIIDIESANQDNPTGTTLYSLQIDPFTEGEMVAGVPEGEWTFRHPNGNISSQGTFVAGQKQGRWRSFYPDGQPESDGLFLNDQPHGAWRYWDDNGTITEARYAYGKPIAADATSLDPQQP